MSGARARPGEIGFSLIELMVGMVLGLMLIAGAVSVYLASKRSYVEVEQVAALIENARFAEQLVGDSLRHAGFLGEVPASRVQLDPKLGALSGSDCTSAGGGAEVYNLNRLGFAVTATTANPLGCIDDAYVPAAGVPGDVRNDVLVIKHSLPLPYTDGPRVDADPKKLTKGDGIISVPEKLSDKKTYVMTNNEFGVLFDGADTAPSITQGGDVPGGTAWEYQYEVFYIRNEGGIPRLSRKKLVWDAVATAMSLQTEDIAEGVERLHLMFGYDSTPPTPANPVPEVDTYDDLAGIGSNWDGVQSVEVFMLVRSATEDKQYTDNKIYRLGNSSVGPFNDNYRRMVSHTSISLRNLKLMIRGGA